MPLDHRRGLLNEILQLRGLRLRGCLGSEIEHRLVYIDLGVDVRPVEVLPLGGGIQRIHLLLAGGCHRVARWSCWSNFQLCRQCFTLYAELVMIAHHPLSEVADGSSSPLCCRDGASRAVARVCLVEQCEDVGVRPRASRWRTR